MKFNLRQFAITVISFVALTGCGAKNKSQLAGVQIVPDQPIVFTAGINIPMGTTVVAVNPPWFRFGVNLNNKTGDDVTIISMTATVSAISPSGQMQTAVKTFDPSTFDYSTDLISCTYYTFGTFADNQSGPLTLTGAGGGCSAGEPVFYMSALPSVGTGYYTYTVSLEIDGWFGTETAPKDRFQRLVYFTTQ